MPNPSRIDKIIVPKETPLVDYTNGDAVHPALTANRQAELIQYVDRQVQKSLQDRLQWIENNDLWYRMWRGMRGEKNNPWPGSSNVVLRETYDHTERTYGKYVDTYLNQESFLLVRGENDATVDIARDVDKFVNAEMRDNIEAYFPIADTIHLACRSGVGFVKQYWCERTRLIRETVQEPVLAPLVDPNTGEEAIDPTTGEPVMADTGERRDVVQTREEVIKKGVRMEPITNPSDVIWPSGYDNPQTCPWIVHRYKISVDELRRQAYEGVLDEAAVESLPVGSLIDQYQDTSQSDKIIDDSKREAQGIETDSQSEEKAESEITLYEVQMRYPLMPDSFEEECIFTYAPGTKFLLRGHLNKNDDGRRSIYAIRHNRVEGEMCGVGVPELVADLNDVMNTSFNMMMDQLHLNMLGMMRIDPDSEAANDDGKIYPMKVWRAKMNEVDWMRPNPVNPFTAQIIEFIAAQASKYTGITALSRGVAEENRPVARVTEIRSSNLAAYDKVKVNFMGQDLKAVYEGIIALYRQYGDNEMVYRVVNPDNPADYQFGSISREQLRFTPDIVVKAIDAEKAILRENRLQLLQLVMQLSQIPFQQQMGAGVDIRKYIRDSLKDYGIEKVNEIVLPDEQVQELMAAMQQQMNQAAAQASQDLTLKALENEANIQQQQQEQQPTQGVEA